MPPVIQLLGSQGFGALPVGSCRSTTCTGGSLSKSCIPQASCSQAPCSSYSWSLPCHRHTVSHFAHCRRPLLHASVLQQPGVHRSPQRWNVTVHATATKAAEEAISAEFPASREAAVQQACQALSAQLELKKGKKGSKGFKAAVTKRLAVDIPVADQSAAGAASLAAELLAGLPREVLDSFTVLFADAAAATVGGQQLSNPVGALEGRREAAVYTGPVLVVAPTAAQVQVVEELTYSVRGPAVVLLNAEWSAEDAPAGLAGFVKSFEAVYTFMPLQLQGFLTKTDGVVFKWAKKGSPAAAPWYIFKREGSRHVIVGRQQRRPQSADLELAFYNAAAAKSPITQGVKFFKGLAGKKQ